MKKKVTEQGKTEFSLTIQDCVEGMRKLSSESVDVVVTSPPYNIGTRYNAYNDRRKREDYLRWTVSWATEVKRVLKPSGSLFLNIGGVSSDPLLPHELVVEVGALFTLQNTFHWIKSITVQTRDENILSVGHFKPINSRRFVNDCHEFIFHLTKHGSTPLARLSLGVPYADKSNVTRWAHTKGKDLRCRGNNWFIPYETIQNRAAKRPHPATFPAQLAANCIKIHGWTPDLVLLDPFMGIGNSAVAAKQLAIRKFIGFDIDGDYVELAHTKIGICFASLKSH